MLRTVGLDFWKFFLSNLYFFLFLLFLNSLTVKSLQQAPENVEHSSENADDAHFGYLHRLQKDLKFAQEIKNLREQNRLKTEDLENNVKVLKHEWEKVKTRYGVEMGITRPLAGPQGPLGEQGQKGDMGSPGQTGSPGDKGDTGPAGENGSPGPMGDVGPAGQTGESGDPGQAVDLPIIEEVLINDTLKVISTFFHDNGKDLKDLIEFQMSHPRSCSDDISAVIGQRQQQIYPAGSFVVDLDKQVLCDFETEGLGGGWTIIQRRRSGPKSDFFREWTDYEQGFGSLDGNFWLGLTTIYHLTKDGDQELQIELTDWDESKAYAKYSNFSVAASSELYRLTIGGYSGTAGDSMAGIRNLNGTQFTSKDQDNDKWRGGNCAEFHQGAWWYLGCGNSNLNGLYYQHGETPNPSESGIFWHSWKNSFQSLMQVEMKIRRRQDESRKNWF